MKKPVTIADAEALLIDKRTGKYPTPSNYRDEFVLALRFASQVWGPTTLWTDIEESHWYELARRRVDDLVSKGFDATRSAAITLERVRTTVRWLREKGHIPRDAAPYPGLRAWEAEIDRYLKSLRGDARAPVKKRLEHTEEEARAILKASALDARFELLMWLGMDHLLGHVARTRRSDLDLPPHGSKELGTLRVHRDRAHLSGVFPLDAGQRRVLDRMLGVGGYLHKFEKEWTSFRIDYLLFPRGYMVNRVGQRRGQAVPPQELSSKANLDKHVGGSWIRKTFSQAEKAAGVPHILGRGVMGLRRLSDSASLDRAKRQALRGELVSAPTLTTVAAADAPPDFAPLTADAAMSALLQRRWLECVKCVGVRADLAAIVMMGGLLEALLVARAELLRDKAPLFASKSSPKDPKTGDPLVLRKWTLAPYIDVAHELGWISKSAKDVAVVLRDYRNYVHPAKEHAHGVSFEAEDSQMFWDLTKKLSSQLLASVLSVKARNA